MDPSEWIARFRVTHEQAKAKKLSAEEHKAYLGMREELARSLALGQALQVPPGANFRKHFRVSQMYALEVNNLYKAMTKDISVGGFAAMLPVELKVGAEVEFSINVKRDTPAVTGKAKVVSAIKQGMWRCAFQVVYMTDDNTDRLETALFDAVLSRF